MSHLLRLVHQLGFLVAHSRPEFDSLKSDLLLLVLHSNDGQLEVEAASVSIHVELTLRPVTHTKQGPLHIKLHLVVVKLHDLDKTLESSHLNGYRRALGSLANDLHDIVPLAFPLKVVPDELQTVVKCLDGSPLNIHVGLLFSCSLHDGSENFI